MTKTTTIITNQRSHELSKSVSLLHLIFCLVLMTVALTMSCLLCCQESKETRDGSVSRNSGVNPASPISTRAGQTGLSCSDYILFITKNLRKIAAALDLELKIKFLLDRSNTFAAKTKDVVRLNTVLMAYKRSGSSFVGQIFNQHPDVLYLYEPLYFMKNLANKHTSAYKILSQRLLKIIFTCNFQEHPYYVSQLSDSAFRLYSKSLSAPPDCPKHVNPDKVQDYCSRLHTSTLTDICQSHRHIVIKSIRVDSLDMLKDYKDFSIEMPWSMLKVVHLVRDPRAIISSRASIDDTEKTTNWTAEIIRENARALCTRMLNNLKGGASEDWSGVYHVIRYEDVAREPEQAAKELYKFLKLPASSAVWDWLRNNTNSRHDSNAFSTTKNATISLNKWRLENRLESLRVIEDECSLVMVLLGYKKVSNEMELVNLSKPLFFVNEEISIYVTRRVRQTLLEIEKLTQLGV